MPWLSMPFGEDDENINPKIKELKSRFGVKEMPILVVVEARQLRLINFHGRKDIRDGMDAIHRWRKERSDRYPADYPLQDNSSEDKNEGQI